ILHAEGLLGCDAGSAECASHPPAAEARPRVRLRPAELARGRRLLAERLPAGTRRPPAVLVTGAGMAVKRWPHWARLAEALADRGHPVVIVGEPQRMRAAPYGSARHGEREA